MERLFSGVLLKWAIPEFERRIPGTHYLVSETRPIFRIFVVYLEVSMCII